MRIAFADFSGWDFHAMSVDTMPMGGSQSAACHLARCLVRERQEVFLIGNVSSAGVHDGVTCLAWNAVDAPRLRSLNLDVLVCILAAGNGVLLRQMLGSGTLLILWNQHAHDQPGVQALGDPRERAAYDAFAMVSDWQREQYQRCFGIEPQRMTVMRNAIAPAFAGLFAGGESILRHKAMPPVLAYTSTPFRGLDLLLDAFPQIRSEVPGAGLRVFSSMKVYQASAADDEAAHGALYERCRQTEGVEYVGSLSQPALARELRSAAVLAYPNTFAETSCISVMEAMAAGCCVVTSRLGALPETCAGFGRLIACDQSRESYLRQFVGQTVQLLRECAARGDRLESELRRQVAHMNQTATWQVRAREWMQWLARIAKERGAAVAGRQDVVTIPDAFARALAHHQGGRLAEAEAIYRQILSHDPNHADALHFLGVIAHQAGRNEIAVDLIRKAIQLNPNDPEYHSNLGEVFRISGRLEQAIAAYRAAIRLKPDFAIAHNNLGNALWAQGLAADAVSAYRTAIGLDPGYANAYCNLGVALMGQGHLEQATEACRTAIRLDPAYADAHYNLGIILKKNGRPDEAIGAYRNAITLKPDFAEAHSNLGVVLREQGRLDEAAAVYRTAIRLKPDYAEAHCNLGGVLKDQGQLDEAIASFRTAIRLSPDFAMAYSNLGVALKEHGQLDEAIASYRTAIRLKPDYAEAHSNLVFDRCYHPDYDAAALGEEARRWNQQHAEPLRPLIQPHGNDRSPGRRLRVGYVSPDLRDHPVGRFLVPVLSRHDRQHFEIFIYAQVPVPDALTQRLRSYSDHWRSITGVPDEKAAEQIRQDGIDVLVDLALHTAQNRLLIFARKPAPVQVTFAGYPGSTGLTAIDYRLSDPYLDPPGSDDGSCSEQTVRLPHTFWCYDPLEGRNLPVPDLPARNNHCITFGCLNNFCKINDAVLRLWARVMNAVPGSRLLLLAPEGTARQRTLLSLEKEGVAPGRIDFAAHQSRAKYLELYQRIDVGLDSFPYNGHTTSLDSYWMGVPVVTLLGRTIVGRAGLSQLMNLGMPELVARSHEEYVRIAVELARDLPRLAGLRATLRQRMEASPLMDAPGFARGLEAAYRGMWGAWCGKQSARIAT